MTVKTPYAGAAGWDLEAARWLFEQERRPPHLNDEVVTAFRDGVVTARSNRRTEGFTNAVQEIGYHGVRAGDLVIHSMDGFAGAIGVSDSDGKASPVVHCYRPRPGVDARYYAYLLRDLARRGFISSLAKGIRERSTAFDVEAFRSLVLPVPPLTTQQSIADYLDAETTRIDALIERKRRMVKLSQERWRASAAREMLRLLQEHRQIPLRRLVRCLDGKRVPLSADERGLRQGPYPYYGASTIVDYVDDFLFDEDLVLVGEDGAQLGEPSYPISQRVGGKIWVNNHAHVLRPLGLDPDLLVFHLNTLDRVPYMSGATREKITQEDLGRIPFPVMSIEEQREVAARLTLTRTQCDNLAQRLDVQMALLSEHRQALITAAVTGQLDIPGLAA